jgi:hypothetical protein
LISGGVFKKNKAAKLSKVKSPAGAIFMKFFTLDLFLTRNQMEQVLGPEKDPSEVILGVKGQYGQK